MVQFQRAKAVWIREEAKEYNQFAGFYCRIAREGEWTLHAAVAARSYYRLYLNGEMAASGPARTAKHYARVDELSFAVSGNVDVAIEVAAYAKPGNYSNDCTLEPGMLTAELTGDNGEVLAATGDAVAAGREEGAVVPAGREEGDAVAAGREAGSWRCMPLRTRRALVETMSHSRGIVEYYDLDPQSDAWRRGEGTGWQTPVAVEETVTYLKRRVPYPDYHRIPLKRLSEITDIVPSQGGEGGAVLTLARFFNPEWYDMLPEENCFLESLRKEQDAAFTGRLTRERAAGRERFCVVPGEGPAALLFEGEASELGFLELSVETERECTLDVINSDHLHFYGSLRSNSYVTRYHLAPGAYHLITFEPKLTRFVKLIFRTEGEVRLSAPCLLDDSYPDDHSCTFSCSDGDLNRIYEAARRTLRLNTLDIFMDCPQRERGGWLCDSQFTAAGAWQLFGDLTVEKDFIENFMLTDADEMWHGFFPEVYPGSKGDPGDPGIANWSFWLMTELKDYYDRSGDTEFIERCRGRVERFVEGLLSLRGESGLIEGLKNQFVDWSLSNRSFCLAPISVPNNCLAVCLLEKMAALYDRADWRTAADQMRGVIEAMDDTTGIFGGGGDSATFADGKLRRGECPTESGIALELWSGFHGEDAAYLRRFVNTMGVAPKYRADPNVGKANLFIGQMIRFDVLARMGKIDALLKEWKELYLPQLAEGSGTLFENYAAFSGCHGFNGATGALMTNHVLGLGAPMQRTKSLRIAPHPCGLRWARGTARCAEGMISFSWSADEETHELTMRLVLPEGWKYELCLPFELSGWRIWMNGERVD